MGDAQVACRRAVLWLCIISGIAISGIAFGCRNDADHTSPNEREKVSSSETTAADTSAAPDSTETTPLDTMTSASTDTSDPKPLTATEKKRLGPTLQRLLRADSLALNRLDPVTTRDGSPVYEVFIECDDPTELRDAGLPLTSVQGALITARLTVDQIRTAATMEAVRSIRAATQLEPHSPGASPSAPGSSSSR